jgi:hypothetical protein
MGISSSPLGQCALAPNVSAPARLCTLSTGPWIEGGFIAPRTQNDLKLRLHSGHLDCSGPKAVPRPTIKQMTF